MDCSQLERRKTGKKLWVADDRSITTNAAVGGKETATQERPMNDYVEVKLH